MSKEVVVFVGASGKVVWRSEGSGAVFEGMRGLSGIDVSARRFTFALHDSCHVIVGLGLRIRCRGPNCDVVPRHDKRNSPVWCFAHQAADPALIFSCTRKGMLFGTEDGGGTWPKQRREFSGVRSVSRLPG